MTYICVLISKLPWTPRDFWTACTHDKSFYMLPFIFQFRNIFYKKKSKFNIFSFVLLNAAQGERTRGVANFSYIFSARLVEKIHRRCFLASLAHFLKGFQLNFEEKINVKYVLANFLGGFFSGISFFQFHLFLSESTRIPNSTFTPLTPPMGPLPHSPLRWSLNQPRWSARPIGDTSFWVAYLRLLVTRKIHRIEFPA